MANQKLTDLTAKTTVLTTDVYHVVDTVDTSQDPAGSSYKITWATLKTAILGYFSAGTGITFSGGVIASDPTASQTLTNKTLTSPVLNTPIINTPTLNNTGVLTLPTSTDTLVGRATTDTLTNKTLTTPTITKPAMSATNPTAQTYTPSAAGTATLDLSLSNQHQITMPAGNITIALSNDTNNQPFIISITQDGSGSRTVTWFTTIRWVSGVAPTLSTTASKRDTFGFIRTGSGTYDGFVIGQLI